MLPFRVQDAADILLMSMLMYQLYKWFRHTRTLQVLMGLGGLAAFYVLAKNLGLFMTSWVLQELGTAFFVLVIVIFQNEIRQALYRFSLVRHFFEAGETSGGPGFSDLSGTFFSLGAARTGAIVVFERKDPLDEYLLHGIRLDAIPGSQILLSIFHKESPLHDGAAIFRKGKIAEVCCHLPLSSDPDIPRRFGTRHRAALGISEKSDAVVVVVSEETGEVSIAREGVLSPVNSPEELARRLDELLVDEAEREKRRPVALRYTANLKVKAAIVCLVVVAWLGLRGREGEIIPTAAQVRFHNLPDNLVVVSAAPEEVDLRLRVLSGLVPSSRSLDICADLDLSAVKPGTAVVPIREEEITLPAGISLHSANPRSVKVVVERKIRKKVPVVVGGSARGVVAVPSTIEVEGPEGAVSGVGRVEAEPDSPESLARTGRSPAHLRPPSASVRILHDGPVTIRAGRRVGAPRDVRG